MRVKDRPTALALVVALALSIAGCGDAGSEDSQGSGRAGEPPAESAQSAAGAQPAGEETKQGGRPEGKDGGGSNGSTAEGGGPESEPNTAPLRVSGGGSAQFEVKGGDNSVQEYGAEADEGELREAAEVVHSFYLARASEEWERACSYLAASLRQSLAKLAAGSAELRGAGCPGVLAALTRPLSPALERQTTAVDAAALRRDGEQGFLIYTGPPGETVYSMPLNLEAGEWRVGALTSSVLPGT